MFNNNFLMVGGSADTRTSADSLTLLTQALESWADRWVAVGDAAVGTDHDLSLLDFSGVTARTSMNGPWYNHDGAGSGSSSTSPYALPGQYGVDSDAYAIVRMKGQPSVGYQNSGDLVGSPFYNDGEFPSGYRDDIRLFWHMIPSSIFSTWKTTDFGTSHYSHYIGYRRTDNSTGLTFSGVPTGNTRNDGTVKTTDTTDNYETRIFRFIYIDPTDMTIKLIRVPSSYSVAFTESIYTSDYHMDITSIVLNWYYGPNNWKHAAINPSPAPSYFSVNLADAMLSETGRTASNRPLSEVSGLAASTAHGKPYPDGSGMLFYSQATGDSAIEIRPFMNEDGDLGIQQMHADAAGAVADPLTAASKYIKGISPGVSGLWFLRYNSAADWTFGKVPYEQTPSWQDDTTNSYDKNNYWGQLAFRVPSATPSDTHALGDLSTYGGTNTPVGFHVSSDETKLWIASTSTGPDTLYITQFDVSAAGVLSNGTTISENATDNPGDIEQFLNVEIDDLGNIIGVFSPSNDTLVGNLTHTGNTPTLASTSYAHYARGFFHWKFNINNFASGLTFQSSAFMTKENGWFLGSTLGTGPSAGLFYQPRSCAARVPTFSPVAGWQVANTTKTIQYAFPDDWSWRIY